MPRGNINIVSGNVTCTPSSFLKTVCDIDTVPLKVSLYPQWSSEYSCSQNTYIKTTPSGYINTIFGTINQHAQ